MKQTKIAIITCDSIKKARSIKKISNFVFRQSLKEEKNNQIKFPLLNKKPVVIKNI